MQALVAPGAAALSRKQLDEIAEKAKSLGARGVYTVKVTAEGDYFAARKKSWRGEAEENAEAVGAKAGRPDCRGGSERADSRTPNVAALIAGQVRLYLGDKLKLIARRPSWEFLWITGFALFEWSATEKALVSAQHPFTGIVEEDFTNSKTRSDEVPFRSKGYDLVLNGVELGSGSIRIHQQEVQARMFKMLGLSEEQRGSALDSSSTR